MYYLGYPQTPDDRVDLPTWALKTASFEALTQAPVRWSYTTCMSRWRTDISTGDTPPNLGFGPLSFTVADVVRAVERLRSEGVKIVKEIGHAEYNHAPFGEWEENRGVGVGEMHENYWEVYERFAFVADLVCSFLFLLLSIYLLPVLI